MTTSEMVKVIFDTTSDKPEYRKQFELVKYRAKALCVDGIIDENDKHQWKIVDNAIVGMGLLRVTLPGTEKEVEIEIGDTILVDIENPPVTMPIFVDLLSPRDDRKNLS